MTWCCSYSLVFSTCFDGRHFWFHLRAPTKKHITEHLIYMQIREYILLYEPHDHASIGAWLNSVYFFSVYQYIFFTKKNIGYSIAIAITHWTLEALSQLTTCIPSYLNFFHLTKFSFQVSGTKIFANLIQKR